MSSRVARAAAATAVALAVVIGIFVLTDPGSTSNAQNRAEDLRGLFQQLVDENRTFLIEFAMPVLRESDFLIPGEIENEEGGIIGRRFVREIGDDYLCVDEIGQGATTTICVPFTNIAYLNFTP